MSDSRDLPPAPLLTLSFVVTMLLHSMHVLVRKWVKIGIEPVHGKITYSPILTALRRTFEHMSRNPGLASTPSVGTNKNLSQWQ